MADRLLKRSEIRTEDTWKLEDYFASDELWKEACEKVEKMIHGYQKYCGHLADSADILYECLQFDDELCEFLERVYCYAHQKQDQDTTEGIYQEFYGKAFDLYTAMASESSFIPVEITAMGGEKIRAMMEEKPELKAYERVFDLILRKEKYMRSDVEEKLLARAGSVTGAAGDIYKMFNNADIRFEPAVDSQGEQYSVTHGTFVHRLENKDRVLRRSAYESVYTAYGNYRNTLAAMLQAKLKEHSFYARTRGYDSPVQYALFSNGIPVEVYDNLVEAVREALPVMYRYVALRKKMLGLEKLSLYDVYVPVVKTPEKKYSFEEAKDIVYKALEPMGEEYRSVLKEGFDNRWIDIYENEGKRSGAYSTSSYSVHPYVLMNYNGSLDHVFTLAHEMGHALHSWFSNHNQPYCCASYKIFVAEVASTCNEALLNHYLLEHAQTKEEKAYIINSYLDSFKGTIFRQTMFAEFEKKAHEMVWNGETLTADKLCSIYHGLNEDYFGPDMDVDSFIDMEWARIPHFYTPFYVYQYATGFSAAIALSSRILKLGEEGVADYMKFLKGGNSQDPIDLLKLAGVDMTSKEPVREAMKVFSGLIDELEALLDS
ncbi:MAG: oligoendopeptidase F [Lachnospiraceae bacterium]|nr:oligoendopeptidase F [Lachnospiraceae bacterium]